MEDDILNRGDSVAFKIAFEEPSRTSGSDPRAEELRKKQIEFLEAQIALKAVEGEKLQADFTNLRAEEKTFTVETIRERLKLVFDVGLALFGIALIALIGFAIYTAARSQSVVVDALSVPPDFAAQGQTGVVVAGGLLDQLQALQDATRASAQHHHIEDAWSNDIRIAIPETGVSLGELMGYLRTWLSHDVHIGGSLVRVGDGIVLNVRGSGVPAKSFAGKPSELPALTTQAAEYVYGQSEPYLFSAYLEGVDRNQEAITLITKVFSRVDKDERVRLLTAWGNGLVNLGDTRGSIEKYQEEIRLNPKAWIAYNNVINSEMTLGEEEGALQTADQMEKEARKGIYPDEIPALYRQNQEFMRMDLTSVHAAFVADMEANRGQGTSTTQAAPFDAELLARLHEIRAAEMELETSPGAGSDPYVAVQGNFVRGLIEIEAGRLAAAYELISAADAAVSQSAFLTANFNVPPTCLAGLLAEMTGRPATADADIARGGHFEDCYRFKAEIADHRGNWSEAEKDFRAAIALAPSMPSGYFSWGEALMHHHDFAGAAQKFAQANANGPHWADPLKRWGDALAWQSDVAGAIAKYQEAQKFAPRWGGLQIAWGHALDRLGRHDQAVEKYRAALTMDLSGDEHWSLRGCCG